MRAFLTLCLIAVVSSEKLGYNYGPNTASLGGSGIGGGLSGGGVSYNSGSGFGGALSSGGLSSGGSYNNGGFLGSGGSYSNGGLSSGGSYSTDPGFGIGGGVSSGGIGSGFINSNGGGFGSASNFAPAAAPVATELNKEYYIYSAPEDTHEAAGSQNSQAVIKKNLRVVFIKSPENNGIANAALQVVKQATEDQTAIYVLTKQADVSDITEQLQQVSASHSKKPEVHFVKYRTQEDILNAQRAIQAQYDSLGGSSKSSDEGFAPVLNYASQNSGSNYQASASQPTGSYTSSASAPSTSYAPSSSSYSTSSNSYSAPSGTGSYPAPSASYVTPKSSYLPPVVV